MAVAQDQMISFLSDLYSVEQQALAQLSTAPTMAGDPMIASNFSVHYEETRDQADRVGERLESLGGSKSAIKDEIMKLGGKGFLLFARVLPETPARLVAHSYSYEAMEWAGYDMLIRFANRADDQTTVAMAASIRDQERAMMQRLESCFDAAESLSHRSVPQEEMPGHICRHLAEAHALESQNERLVRKSEDIGGDERLAELYREQLEQTERDQQLLQHRLEALGSDRSHLQDAALASGGINWGWFFQAQSDTPAKLAAFVYAFQHLRIAGYELLKRSASRAGDSETEQLCDQILSRKRDEADRLQAAFENAVQSTLYEPQAK